VNSVKEQADAELYFEMEFPGKDPDTISFSSKSIESFSSETTNPDSRQSPLRESTSREGSVGPDRPSTLTIPTLASALPKLSRFKREAQYGSLPRVKGGHKVPKINFQNMSVPTTPADSWGRGEGEYMHQRDLSSSVSSVEEATEAVVTPRSKSKSRLSLNLGVFDSVSLGPGSPARSPRFLPKFLRSSFSKLMQSKDRTPEPPAAMEPMSLPFFSSVLSRSRCPTPEEEEPVEESPPSSPTTKTFVEESLAKGLPIIPFNYPTFVIVEKKISDAKAHHQAASPLPGPPLFSSWGASEKKETRSVSAPTSRKTSRLEGRSVVGKMGQSVDDKSLSSVVSMAKQEMEEEKQEGSLRKPSWIRGYAFNNSRALHRRRSSVTEYVAPMEENTTNSSLNKNTNNPSLQEEERRGQGRTKLRNTKSLCQAENMRFIHEEESLGQLDLVEEYERGGEREREVEEYKRELRNGFCHPEARMDLERPFGMMDSTKGKENDQMISPYLDMECGTGRRVDVKPTIVA